MAAIPTTGTPSNVAAAVAQHKIQHVDSGTSGGIWGLAEGYSLMIGGDEAVVERLRPIFEALAPARDRGWGRVGPVGSGHYTKIIADNGIEYGLMQAYAEGLSILQHKSEFLNLDLHQVAEIWRYGSVVRSWLLDLTANALEKNPDAEGHRTLRRRIPGKLAAGPLPTPLNWASRPRSSRLSLLEHCARATMIPSPTSCSRRCATSSADTKSRKNEPESGDESSHRRRGRHWRLFWRAAHGGGPGCHLPGETRQGGALQLTGSRRDQPLGRSEAADTASGQCAKPPGFLRPRHSQQ